MKFNISALMSMGVFWERYVDIMGRDHLHFELLLTIFIICIFSYFYDVISKFYNLDNDSKIINRNLVRIG